MRGRTNTRVNIVVTNMGSQVLTHSRTLTHKLLSEFLVSYMGVFCCLFVLCHLAAPDEGEQSDESENGTV